MEAIGNVIKAKNDLEKALSPSPVTAAPTGKTPAQAAYEAKTDAMNAQNPYYKAGDAVPRAKGGPVKAGGAKMKTVDSSIKKMKMGCK